MDFAADFTAIDFETANRRADSACQLAAVIVRQGRMVDQAMWMIRPRPLFFSRSNIRIHGITPQQVRSEPVFGDIWPDIVQKLGDDCLVAHNASFDIGVLLACLRAHRQQIPDLHFTCTRAIARRTWPHHRRYGLKPLSNWLGIRFRHHDALEDSIACAKILLAAGMDREVKSLPDLEKDLRLSRGTAGSWGHQSPTSQRRRKRPSGTQTHPDGAAAKTPLPFLFPGPVDAARPQNQIEAAQPVVDLQRLIIRGEFIQPLSGLRIVFTGPLRALSRPEAESLAVRLGAVCCPTIDESTDFVVLGSLSRSSATAATADVEKGDTVASKGESTQMALTDPVHAEQRARQLQAGGQSIRIVSEDEFFGLLTETTVKQPR